jgi:tRNA nucleotidyltransferase (CCA-adding enzyme)
MRLMSWREGTSKLSRLYAILHPIPVEGVLFLMARSRKEHIRRNISQYLTRLRHVEVEVTGADLQELGLTPGPVYTVILEKIMEARIDGRAETRAAQLGLAQRLARDLSHADEESEGS